MGGGVSIIRKNTAFGLYRDGTELRGIYPAKAQNAREICKATGLFGCDFPSLMLISEFLNANAVEKYARVELLGGGTA
jgi:hypothetical protein